MRSSFVVVENLDFEFSSRIFMGRGMLSPMPVRQGVFFRLADVSLKIDRDQDGITDIFDPDNDNDLLDDFAEVVEYGTNPNHHDTDEDGIPDGWEIAQGYDPLHAADANNDKDGDGFTTLDESTNGSEPDKYVIILTSGWNLVAVARKPRNNSIDAIFGGTVIGTVWHWNADRFEGSDSLQPLTGYWVYAPEAAAVEIQLP